MSKLLEVIKVLFYETGSSYQVNFSQWVIVLKKVRKTQGWQAGKQWACHGFVDFGLINLREGRRVTGRGKTAGNGDLLHSRIQQQGRLQEQHHRAEG